MNKIRLEERQLVRSSVQNVLEDLPEKFTVAELLYQVKLYEDIKVGLKAMNEGNTYSEDEVVEIIKSWSL